VRFALTEEQEAVRRLARDLFEKESPPSRLRALYDGAAPDDGCWRAMAAAGLLGLPVPAEHGGASGTLVDLVPVLEEAGRAALPEPVVEALAVAAPALAEASLAEAHPADWLAALAAGEAFVTAQVDALPSAPDADRADLVVAEREGALVALPRGSFRPVPVESEDRARRLFAVEPLGSLTPLEGASPSRASLRARAAVASLLNGVSMRLLEMTVAHVTARQQFGRPVGSFQVVQHHLASAHVALEAARAAAWYAAWAVASDLPDAPLAASVAKERASEAAALANRVALQCHGGIGFTWEHDLHLWLKRGKALEQAYGSAREHRARIARHLLEEGVVHA
jgi:alkylation response protein AidB-like acyl-CoA dehydrogenase